MKIVLEWSSSKEEFTLGVEFSDDLRELTFFVLDFVGFIDDNIMKLDFFKVAEANSDALKGGDNDVELAGRDAFFDDILTLLFGSDQFDHSAAGKPFAELILPVTQSDFRGDDDVWAFDFLEFLDEGDDGNGLDGFSQAHIISENAVDTAFIQRDHPVETYKLIILELTTFEDGGLFGEAGECLFFMFLFLNDVVNLIIFLIEVAASFGPFIDGFFHDLMFGEEEVGVEFGLADETFDGLVGGGIGRWFECGDLFEYDSFKLILVFDVGVIELHPAKCNCEYII
jgi:hypothetical protein